MRNRAPIAQVCAFDGSAQEPAASAEQSSAGSSTKSAACSRLRPTTAGMSSIRLAAAMTAVPLEPAMHEFKLAMLSYS